MIRIWVDFDKNGILVCRELEKRFFEQKIAEITEHELHKLTRIFTGRGGGILIGDDGLRICTIPGIFLFLQFVIVCDD